MLNIFPFGIWQQWQQRAIELKLTKTASETGWRIIEAGGVALVETERDGNKILVLPGNWEETPW